MKRAATVADILQGLKKSLDDGGAFDAHLLETTNKSIEEEGVRPLAGGQALLLLLDNSQVFEIAVRERR